MPYGGASQEGSISLMNDDEESGGGGMLVLKKVEYK